MQLNVYLIDGSGSMRIAWFAAFDALFRELKVLKTPALLLAFQQKEIATRNAVAHGEYAAIINIAEFVRQKSLVVLRRAPQPEEVGFWFMGQTPLLESIVLTMKLVVDRFRKLKGATIHLFTDNRDSMVLKYPEYAKKYNNNTINDLKKKYGFKIVAHLMGDPLLKYLEAYDEVRLEINPSLLRLI